MTTTNRVLLIVAAIVAIGALNQLGWSTELAAKYSAWKAEKARSLSQGLR